MLVSGVPRRCGGYSQADEGGGLDLGVHTVCDGLTNSLQGSESSSISDIRY
jgi:hypothetical protein